MRIRNRNTGLLLVLALWTPQGLFAQRGNTAGVVGGVTSSRQLWGESGPSAATEGILLGVYVRVPTPLPHLAVRAEMAYAQRGGLLSERELQTEQPISARVRAHYLSFPVHLETSWELGPVRLFAFGGPTLEITQDTSADPTVIQLMGVERITLFGVGYGAGLGGPFPGGLEGSLEVRGLEGISEAYDEGPVPIRNRSFEVLLRVGFPFGPGAPG
jgi:hypothetical protein